MVINIKKVNGTNVNVEIIYAYEFNKEAVVLKDKDISKTNICFIVKDETKKELQEYYYKKDKPNCLWWHNVFYAGTTFEKKLKDTKYGDTFKHQKDIYLWRKLTIGEIEEIIKFKNFDEEV